jgi:hypothetical protein
MPAPARTMWRIFLTTTCPVPATPRSRLLEWLRRLSGTSESFVRVEGSSLSRNRDAVLPACDSSPLAGVSASLTAAGSSSQTSPHVAVSLAPCLIRVFGPCEFLLVTLPGTARTSRFHSRAQREVIRVPLDSAASTTSTPIEMPLMMRLRMENSAGPRRCSWEIQRRGRRPGTASVP